jgi:hypothetical protein
MVRDGLGARETKTVNPTLVLSTWSLPAAKALAGAARHEGWRAFALDEVPAAGLPGEVVYYGGTDRALEAATRLGLALIEPPLDLLARLPLEYRRRPVQLARFGDLTRLSGPTFVKPADALHKSFDAGIYANVRDIRAPHGVGPDEPVLLAEPVEWSAEYRCFVLEGRVAAWSPYVSFGRPNWKPFGPGTLAARMPPAVAAFCERLFAKSSVALPPAFVMDVGLIDDRGWAVVEFNPAFCSGVLGADPGQVLGVIRRSCRARARLTEPDRRWVINRRPVNDVIGD